MGKRAIHILLAEGPETPVERIREALEAVATPIKLHVVQNIAEARAYLNKTYPALIIIDSFLPDGKGLELLPDKQREGVFPAVIIAGHGSITAAIGAIQAGALDYIVMPTTSLADLTSAIESALHKSADITERQRSRQLLLESEYYLRSFFESAATGMAIISPEGQVIKVNSAFCHLSGYHESEALGKSVVEVTHPDDRAETQRLYDEIRSGQRRILDYEKRYLCKDGTMRWGHSTVAGVYGPEGNLNYFAANVQDITEAKLIQNQIEESQQMLQLILDYIPQHVFWKDVNSVYLGCNRNFARIAGVENPRDLIGKTDYDLPWKKEEADFYRDCDRRIMQTDQPELHIIEPQLQASGKQAWLDANKIPLHDSKGRVTGILGTLEDITERKEAVEKLVEANRELDAFAYTVSHDLRSLLTPIIGYAEVLQEICREKLDQQSLGCLAEIEDQGRRMLALLEDLLTLAKVGHLPRPTEPIDLNALVEDLLIEMGSTIIASGVIIERSHLPEMRIPQTLLEQIFNNLLGNAIRYAGREGSPLEIGGERRENLVQLYVRDHGPGIMQGESRRIFEVFYRGSTSKKCSGTGVGLATVQKIARLYEGQAWVEETPGGGSTFRVELRDEQNESL